MGLSFLPRARREIVHRSGEPGEVEPVRILHHRDDQPRRLERDGDPEVVALAQDDIGARDGRVHHGVTTQTLDRRPQDEGEIGQLLPRLRLEPRLHLRAHPSDARQIDLEEAGDMRRDLLGLPHMVRGEAADLRHRLDHIAGPGRERRLGVRGHRDAHRRGEPRGHR